MAERVVVSSRAGLLVISLPFLTTTRYVSPLREGGSLPALAEASNGELYVVKFRGAGQGRKALVAELVAGEIARALGLNIPELVLVELDPAFGNSEGDPEIQDLLKASAGLNLGIKFLPGALMFDPLAEQVASQRASEIVWFDAFVLNVDRTIRNPNMLCWHDTLWLIDHGASLYFHHTWAGDFMARARAPFPSLRDQVLLPFAHDLERVDAELSSRLSPEKIQDILDAIPDAWLSDEAPFPDAGAVRAAYLKFLTARLETPRSFLQIV